MVPQPLMVETEEHSMVAYCSRHPLVAEARPWAGRARAAVAVLHRLPRTHHQVVVVVALQGTQANQGTVSVNRPTRNPPPAQAARQQWQGHAAASALQQ